MNEYRGWQEARLVDQDTVAQQRISQGIEQLLRGSQMMDIFEMLDLDHNGSISKREWDMFNRCAVASL